MMDAIARFANHVVNTRVEDLPSEAVQAAKVFLADTIGVGVAGSAGPWVEELVNCARGWGAGDEARVWVRGTRLPAPAAALCNAYQIHNAEFDCVHEAAVVHPMAALLAATLAHAERTGGVTGLDLLAALVLGVDVACHIGVGSRVPLTFFRPATAGAFAATAAVGRLLGFDVARLVNAFGIAYSELCGTMQAHAEGSVLLGMQIGFNARNAVVACDLAAHGLVGPQHVLEGPFGYYKLFEGAYDLSAVWPVLGKVWRITEVAHKPFPAGRATHGIVEACLALQQAHGFAAYEVERVTAWVPPLTHRLVGRPIRDDMEPNYARLSAPFVAATALIRGTVGVEDFRPEARADPATLALGRRVEVVSNDHPDPNALTPICVEVRLQSGVTHDLTLDVVYGHPAKPMTRDAHLAKFRGNWTAGATPLPSERGERLIALIDDLEQVEDVRVLVDLMVA
jgi:2-methylcitrate dehydratase PrpD